jgi:hypothetical protein
MKQREKYTVLQKSVNLHHSLVLMEISDLKLLTVLTHLRPELGTSQMQLGSVTSWATLLSNDMTHPVPVRLK